MNPPRTLYRSIACFIVLAVAGAFGLAWSARANEKPAQGESLFNGADLTGWKFRNPDHAKIWVVAKAELDAKDPKKLVAADAKGSAKGDLLRSAGDGHGTDIYTEKSFGDCQLHVEFMIPDGSNSGVYLMGQYEVQILSNVGKPDSKLGPGDCGGIYHTKGPSTNALKPYGEWNSFDITFRAPRFDAAGKKTENAKFIEVRFNDKKIQENVEVLKGTGSELPGGEKPTGPILLQGDHGIVAFRNMNIQPLDLK